jgi:hypothetical protein
MHAGEIEARGFFPGTVRPHNNSFEFRTGINLNTTEQQFGKMMTLFSI